MTEWISVKDRLPKLNTHVLAISYSGLEFKDRLQTFDVFYVAWIDDTEIVDPPNWQYSECCGCSVSRITHWMPLPKRPDVE